MDKTPPNNEFFNKIISLQKSISEARALANSEDKKDDLGYHLDECQSKITELCEKAREKGLMHGEGLTFSEYASIARKTRQDPEATLERLNENEEAYVIIDMLNSAIGMSRKANDILEHVQDVIFRGVPLNKVLLAGKLGDLLWYMALGITGNRLDFVKILSANIVKIKAQNAWAFTKKTNKPEEQIKLEEKIATNSVIDAEL